MFILYQYESVFVQQTCVLFQMSSYGNLLFLVQNFLRFRTHRRNYLRRRRGVIMLQSLLRGHIVRMHYGRATIQIQKIWKGILTRRLYKKLLAANMIQRAFRGYLCNREYKAMRRGVILIQSKWRMVQRRRWFKIAIVDHKEMLVRREKVRLEERKARKAGTLHSEARKVEGVTIVFKIFRSTKEAVTVLGYDPRNCCTYK